MTDALTEPTDEPKRPEPKRDQWGRYIIPDPTTGEERTWTRATTWAGTFADTFAITKWELRMAAIGLAQRDDIRLAVAAVVDPESADGKKKLNQLVRQAKEAARANARATVGTALHSFVEAYDRGVAVRVPAPYDADLAAYSDMTVDVSVSRNYLERICVVQRLGVAGTMDRVVRLPGYLLPLIGDVKTGRDLRYSWTEIAIQLALYAHADTTFDPVTGKHHKMIEVDQKQALVIHLPAGEARCQLYLVDIEAGWRMALLCDIVRQWRKRDDIAVAL